jgi:YesN/AraC family two-component response regulator
MLADENGEGSGKRRGLYVDFPPELGEAYSRASRVAGAKNMDKSKLRILSVDDHLLSLRLISKQLEVMGLPNVRTSSNTEEATKLLAAEDFDIVFLDWAMPGKDGLALLKECRAQSRFDGTAFVMLSSEAQTQFIQQATEAGAVTYIVKPVTQDVFEEKMKSVYDWLEKNKDKNSQRKLLEQVLNSTGNEFAEALSNSVMDTIETMFGQKMQQAQAKKRENRELAVSIMLTQGKDKARLRLVFDRAMLEQLAAKVYTPEEMKDDRIMKDAASEVTNVVCNKIKAFLNERGFKLNMSLPQEDNPEAAQVASETTVNLYFSLVKNTLSIRSVLQVNMS